MKMKWRENDTAPKDGNRFIAWDSAHGYCLFTMHWVGKQFITDSEIWSGSFSHWMPRPEPPIVDKPRAAIKE